jgi:hypothetical protein
MLVRYEPEEGAARGTAACTTSAAPRSTAARSCSMLCLCAPSSTEVPLHNEAQERHLEDGGAGQGQTHATPAVMLQISFYADVHIHCKAVGVSVSGRAF